MKKMLCALGALAMYCHVVAQTFIRPQDPGDIMPDIKLGTVMNFKGERFESLDSNSRISDFKGKLIILDFWNTLCSSCIDQFPHSAALQKKYGSKVQVLLVNAENSPEEVKAFIERKQKWKGNYSSIPDDLPVVVNKDFMKVFPHHGAIGYHAWVGPTGKIVLRGISQNTHEKKIDEYFAGKNIYFIPDNDNGYNGKLSFFATRKNKKIDNTKYNSFIGEFDPYSADAYGEAAIEIDSVAGTSRKTFLNFDALAMFGMLLEEEVNKDRKVFAGIRHKLEVADPSIAATRSPFVKEEITDEIYARAKFCYEQIVPATMPKQQAVDMAVAELNKYLGETRNLEGGVETRTMPCWKLVRTADFNKLINKEKAAAFKDVPGTIQADNTCYWTGTVFEIFSNWMFTVQHRLGDRYTLIIDDSQYEKKIGIRLPLLAKSIDEIRKALQTFGLDLVQGTATIDMIVVKDKKSNAATAGK